MSSTDLSSLAQEGGDMLVIKYYSLATTALVFYDYFLTLPDEIRLIWPGKRSWVFFVFILNRYASFVYVTWFSVVRQQTFFRRIPKTCRHTAVIEGVHTSITTTISQLFLLLRVYAITRRNRVITFVLTLFIIFQLVTSAYMFAPVHVRVSFNVPLNAFHLCRMAPKEIPILTYIGILLAYDGIAFVATLSFSFRNVAQVRSPLIIRMFFDGTIYFIVLFTCNLVWLILILFARHMLKYAGGEPISVITSLMITRFVISLRKMCEHPVEGISFNLSDFTGGTVQFQQDQELMPRQIRLQREMESGEDLRESPTHISRVG